MEAQDYVTSSITQNNNNTIYNNTIHNNTNNQNNQNTNNQSSKNSAIDQSRPYYLHPVENPGAVLVSPPLSENNYES